MRHHALADLAVLFFALMWVGANASTVVTTIHITADKTEIGEGQNVVVTALVEHGKGHPLDRVMLHAQVNGKNWGADYLTLPSGVTQLTLPLPETGTQSIKVVLGKTESNSVNVQVNPRHFNIIDDPSHQVVMEYETWFGPGYADWKKAEALPILGKYSSLDPRVIRQQALWFNEMGFNIVELDWTNNLTKKFPNVTAKECIAATDLLFQVYSTMAQHPKVLLLMGPEHNLWRDNKDVYAGPWFKAQMDYVYDHYINNPAYRGMYVQLEGKPLICYYLNGPRFVPPPDLSDTRFTTRYVGAWMQFTHEDKYGVWSWYDQLPIPIFNQGKVEALTVTDGYPNVYGQWDASDAGGKNYGQIYRSQWEVALQAKPEFLFVNQWNEFVPPDQYNVNLSNDMEPTLMTEKGDSRPSGWGFYYFDLTRDEIAAYHQTIATGRAAEPTPGVAPAISSANSSAATNHP